MKNKFTITIEVDKANEARRISRDRIGKIPMGKTFISNPKPGIDNDSFADPRIELIGEEEGKKIYSVDSEIVLERFACSNKRMEYPKFRFVPKNEIWVMEDK